MSALFLPFFTRERYDVRFINSILSPIFLFLDGRINEETSFKIIVSVDFGGGGDAKISDKLSGNHSLLLDLC